MCDQTQHSPKLNNGKKNVKAEGVKYVSVPAKAEVEGPSEKMETCRSQRLVKKLKKKEQELSRASREMKEIKEVYVSLYSDARPVNGKEESSQEGPKDRKDPTDSMEDSTGAPAENDPSVPDC